LTLFLVNLTGYKCWQYFLLQKINTSLEARLDRQEYQEKDLIQFQIPLSNAYQLNTGFERVDGEIHIQGVIYKYVKRKIEDGKLIILCLPHIGKMQLVHAFGKFNTHSDPVGSAKSPYPDECEEMSTPRHPAYLAYSLRQYNIFDNYSLTTGYPGTPLAPPRFA
jgi:hypothetical protein